MKLTNCNSVYSSKISTNNVGKFGVYKKGCLNQDTISFCSNMPLARKINKYYRSGERHTLNRINKLKPNELRLAQEAIDAIEKSKETNKPFNTFASYLQCDAGCEYVAVKDFVLPDGARVNLRIVFDNNFSPTMSRTEYFDNKYVSWLKNGNKVLIDEVQFDKVASCFFSKNKFEILNNEFGEPEKLIHTKPNSKYPTFYQITEYKFDDYSKAN